MEKRNLASPISHQDFIILITISLKRLSFRGKSLKQMMDMLDYQPILPHFKGPFSTFATSLNDIF